MQEKDKVYPSALYLVRGADGNAHWYGKDPFRRAPEERKESEVNVESILFDYFGQGTVMNPLKVRIGAEMISHCEEYNALTITRKYLEENNRHLEDMEGHNVEILDRKNPDAAYQLNGVVMDKDGNIICYRTFNVKGECSDRNDRHGLVVIRNSETPSVAIRQVKKGIR